MTCPEMKNNMAEAVYESRPLPERGPQAHRGVCRVCGRTGGDGNYLEAA